MMMRQVSSASGAEAANTVAFVPMSAFTFIAAARKTAASVVAIVFWIHAGPSLISFG